MITNRWTGSVRVLVLAGLLGAGLSIAGCGGGGSESGEASQSSAPAYLAQVGPSGYPEEGGPAPDFELESLGGETVGLVDRLNRGPVVLVVLRGYPGYQCPICTRQFGDFLANADAFAEADARVIMVYPGPANNLQSKAEEFTEGKTLPDHFDMLLDPGYTFTNKYSLRWDRPNETAYPATFVIDEGGTVRWVKVSSGHADRSSAANVLKAVKGLGSGDDAAQSE